MIREVVLLVQLVLAFTVSAFNFNISVGHYTDVVWSSVLTDYMTCSYVNNDTITVHMVTNTSGISSGAHDKCVKPSSKDVYELVPVYSRAVDLHFKNRYCSKFISSHDLYVEGPDIYFTLTYWSIVVDVGCFQKHLNALPRVISYNAFLYKLLNTNSGCVVNYHPPLEYNSLSVGIDQLRCTGNIKTVCDSIVQESLKTDLIRSLCSICSWLLQKEACLDPLYIEETQLQTYVMLKPPDDFASVNKKDIDQEWIPETRIFGRPAYIDPVLSVAGLIIDFWVKLLLWDEDDVVSDAKLIAKLEKGLGITGVDIAIRIVDRRNTTNGEENEDSEYQEAIIKGLGSTLRCKQIYMAIVSVGFMDIDYVKAFVKNIKTVLRVSNAFFINSNVTAHFTLRQPSCFPGRAASKESDQPDEAHLEYMHSVIKQLIALAIGFLVPVTIVSIGLCISGIQDAIKGSSKT